MNVPVAPPPAVAVSATAAPPHAVSHGAGGRGGDGSDHATPSARTGALCLGQLWVSSTASRHQR